MIVLVALGAAPGTFVRTPVGHRDAPATQITVSPVDLGAPPPGLLTVTGSWQMRSDHGWFGGFSSLVAGPGESLVAATDRGFLLDIDTAGAAPQARPGSFRFIGLTSNGRKEVVDLEAITRDPASGTLWGAFENANLLMRLPPGGPARSLALPAIAQWSKNSGPETMERLRDGRFLILAEGSSESGTVDRPALLFQGDPMEGGEPVRFRFNCRAAYAPVDMTEVPGGRVLILMRNVRYTVPATFDAVIMIADPAEIRAGGHWRGEIIQRLEGPGYGENFEGIAFVPDPADPEKGAVWIVADDNFSVFQRSLLVRFAWDGSGAALQQRAAVRAAQEWQRALNGVQSPLVICPKIDADG
ncbi:MAG: esterase-like activity of phytase family protein [Porphyrobacter sp.]|nr:esterase-like activity of phytase family protein [Porphyrobacter sp.]